jgi:hypothetical protein
MQERRKQEERDEVYARACIEKAIRYQSDRGTNLELGLQHLRTKSSFSIGFMLFETTRKYRRFHLDA